MRSMLISPTTRTRFALSAAGMDDEALDDPLDDSGGGGVGPAASVYAAEERQQLTRQGIDQDELPVVERAILARDFESDVLGCRCQLCREPLADEKKPPSEPLAPQLEENIPLVRAHDRVRRQKRDNEAVLPDRGHRAMPEAEKRIRQGHDAATVGLQHLQSGFVGRPEAAAAREIDDGRIRPSRQSRDVGGALEEDRARGLRESLRAP